MKMQCKSCGCHFDDDFEETLQPECTMWEALGFSPDMSVNYKRQLFAAYFSVPVDEIADETGVITTIELKAMPNRLYTKNEFETYVPGYIDWIDQEKRKFQKRLFKFIYNQSRQEHMTMILAAMEESDQQLLDEIFGKNS
jgi:hypothetical protein